MSIALRYAARSDIGLLRSNNQDSAYAGPHLLVVADGMGGHAGGDTASSLAVANLAALDDDALGSGEILRRLADAVEQARVDLVTHARTDHTLAGMGTTVTALLRSGNKLAMAHLGDSRAYLLRDELLEQVTVDHTFVQHLVDTGKITPDEAEHHPQRSVVMRVLGDFEVDFDPDLSLREARPGDRWLLCSDGLSGYVSGETIERTLTELSDPGECADQLVQYALRAGGPDNITAVIADIVDLDTLHDNALPSAEVQVVGAAAITRTAPTAAVDGPAARAASLASGSSASDEAPNDELDDDATRSSRRRRWRRIALIAAALVALGAACWFGYGWTQTQYYLGVDRGVVTIYQGIPQSVGPLDLSHPIEQTDIEVEDLPSYVASQLATTITVDSPADAKAKVASIRATTLGAPPVPGLVPGDGT